MLPPCLPEQAFLYPTGSPYNKLLARGSIIVITRKYLGLFPRNFPFSGVLI